MRTATAGSAALASALCAALLLPPCANCYHETQMRRESPRFSALEAGGMQGAAGTQGVSPYVEGTPFRPGVMHGAHARMEPSFLQFIDHEAALLRPDYSIRQVALPWAGSAARPLVSCPAAGQGRSAFLQAGSGEEAANLRKAVATFCSAGLAPLVEFFVDPEYAANYERVKGADGWVDQAFVTYMGVRNNRSKVGAEEDLLVQSVHHFSDKPVLVANFGSEVPAGWSPERFPNLVLLHARSVPDLTGKSFNFNKLTAMLFTKVRAGMVLDADQWVNHGLDSMFGRVAAETTADYPYPIMPVHWMSRDPESDDMRGYPKWYTWTFKSPGAPNRTMRWGHAHPTWTHHALPFLAKWTSRVLAPRATASPPWLQAQGWVEDEDLLNVALWAEGATKQWCKFDIPGVGDFGMYLEQSKKSALFHDAKYYPKGIAYIFFTAHDAKKPEDSYKWLGKLWDGSDDRRKAIFYDGQWFGSGKSLKAYDAGLRCIA